METLARITVYLGLIALLIASPSWAHDAEGNPDLILTPNEGRPLIMTASTNVSIILREKAQLEIVNDSMAMKLSPEWKVINEHRVQATFALSSRVRAGVYSLRATIGERVDYHENAIVFDVFHPEKVAVAIDPSSTLWLQFTEKINIPIALPEKGKSYSYEQRYGTLPFSLDLGMVGLIVFDGQDTRPSKLGQLYPLRRAFKAKTWTIAVSTTPCENLPFRTQLTLFDDDPIDLLLTPEPMPEAYEKWPRTRFLAYPEKANPVRITPNRVELDVEER